MVIKNRTSQWSFAGLEKYFGLAGRVELFIATGLLGLGCLFKFWNVFLFRFDSDEPQHLHVIWAWTHGLVQYRDVFDNHMPLFHLLCAPILGLLGEHATDLYWMRLLMVPLYFLSAWCIYRIGEIAFSRRIGLWAMLLASSISVYHLCSTEFRPDNVWIVLWFLCLITLIAKPFDFRSLMVGGLLLGLCFAISMKTILLLVTILLASGIAAGLVGWRRLGLNVNRLGFGAMVFAACTAVVPLLVMGFFAARGVWPQFQYCVFKHNVEPAITSTYFKPLWFLLGTPALIYATGRFVGNKTNPTVAFRQTFICLTCGLYFLVMQGFWRHLTREDYLALFPLVALVSVVVLFRASDILQQHRLKPLFLTRYPLPAIAASVMMLLDLGLRVPVTNEADKELARVRDVLALTNPDDLVFDCKGETVFRKRSVRYVIESITSGRIERGQIPDELELQPPESRARVAVIGGELSEYSAKFIEANYVPVGHGVMVAGCRLKPSSSGDRVIRLHVAMPDRYELISPDGPVHGLLDGAPFDGPRFIPAGDHTFVPNESGAPLALLWAQAVERHFTNFLTAPSPRLVYRPTSITGPGRRMVDIADEIPDRFLRPVSILHHSELLFSRQLRQNQLNAANIK